MVRLLIVAAVLLSGCKREKMEGVEQKQSSSESGWFSVGDTSCTFTKIDGMDCIYCYDTTYHAFTVGSVDCDWSSRK